MLFEFCLKTVWLRAGITSATMKEIEKSPYTHTCIRYIARSEFPGLSFSFVSTGLIETQSIHVLSSNLKSRDGRRQGRIREYTTPGHPVCLCYLTVNDQVPQTL